jgi:hypothetical protein
MIANSSIKHTTNGKIEFSHIAVGHEWDMRSEVQYLRYAEKCPDPPPRDFFSKHILQEQNLSMALHNSNTMSYAHCSSNNCMLCS